MKGIVIYSLIIFLILANCYNKEKGEEDIGKILENKERRGQKKIINKEETSEEALTSKLLFAISKTDIKKQKS